MDPERAIKLALALRQGIALGESIATADLREALTTIRHARKNAVAASAPKRAAAAKRKPAATSKTAPKALLSNLFGEGP